MPNSTWIPATCQLWPWKRRFDNDAEAYAELVRLRTRSDVTLRHPNVTIFKCQSTACNGWHIGQPNGSSLEKK